MGTSNRPRGLRALLETVVPAATFGDERTILAGTGQNLVGLLAAMLAAFATQVLITRALGAAAYGAVTVATQFAFVAAAAMRVGMDMASVRRVAIEVGAGRPGRVRGIVTRAVLIAAAVSAAAGAATWLASGPLAGTFTTVDGAAAFRGAALALPFAALAQVYLGATRGLKVMRHTLYIYWLGQPLAWIALMLGGWIVSRTVGATVLAYAGSWILATVAAAWAWRRETAGLGRVAVEPGESGRLVRYGGPRVPAALFAQLLFWTDLFVLARLAASEEVGIYAAAVRAAQVILLFLISVNYMFSPFVADLHARGDLDRLGRLFKSLTRWMLAGTLPIFIVMAVVPDAVLRLFGAEFGAGRTALLILVAGQLVNVATGSVGFILIMTGRTGWDLIVNAAAVAFSVTVAALLIPVLGMNGAAVAGALTVTLANLARLGLVWRFIHVQPFTREYLRLALPAAAGVLAAVGVRLALPAGAGWQAVLAGSAAGGTLAYAAVLLWRGLPDRELRILRRLIAGALGRS